MANEALTAAAAANRDVPDQPPGPTQDCADVVHLAVFFDGTGNNKDADEIDKKWSNVARLWRAADLLAGDDTSDTSHVVYLSGVGTAFNGTANSTWDKSWLWTEDNVGGMAAGAGGDRRMHWGHDRVDERLRDMLIAKAQRAGGELKKYADQNRTAGFADVNKALAKHRLIKMINVSIFGFSRGAALARAFSNEMLSKCKVVDGKLTLQGYPVRFNFLGLFDTVASFGVPSQNARLPWQERDLIVSEQIERCVHFVAGHEIRFSFPVDLIRKNGRLSGDWLEKTYPGVHSDVGGGYLPNAQDIDNNGARIPMRDMMRESLASGVRMLSYDAVKGKSKTVFAERFECHAATEAAYAGYMKAFAALGGDGAIEQQMAKHMRLLYAGYGTMHRAGEALVGERRLRENPSKMLLGSPGMAVEVTLLRKAHAAGQWLGLKDKSNLYVQIVKPEAWRMAAWDSQAPDEVVRYLRAYVHDSKVDFIWNIEPFSYFSPRGVKESTRSVWQEMGDWVGDKADAVTKVAEQSYETAETAVEHTYDAAKKKTSDAYSAGKRMAAETYDVASKKATEGYEAGKHQLKEAYGVVKGVAKELTDDSVAAAIAAKKASEDAVRRAGKWADHVGDEGSDGAAQVWQFIANHGRK